MAVSSMRSMARRFRFQSRVAEQLRWWATGDRRGARLVALRALADGVDRRDLG
jgi:hypothetical protein